MSTQDIKQRIERPELTSDPTVRNKLDANMEEAAKKIVMVSEGRPAELLSLAERMTAAKDLFMESVKVMGTVNSAFQPAAEKMITDARQCRYTMATELAIIKKEIKDIQEFVQSTEYTVTVDRMRTLLDIAERFVKLSKEEALPVLLDAALKLQVKP